MALPVRTLDRWCFDAIGTRWVIETGRALGDDERASIMHLIDRFDRQWSRFRDDSLVSTLAARAGAVDAPPDAAEMFETYGQLADATDNAVNPLVGASLEALGYDRSYSLSPGAPRAAETRWRDILHWDEATMRLTQPALIDVGALGKGRLVDLVHAQIGRLGIDARCVDAGGDLRVSGAPERVGLEHPYDPQRVLGVFTVADAALCASAINRRAWGDGLHHVLDARTGLPVRTIAATWVLAPDAMTADAAATALFFDGGPALAHRWGVSWVRMTTSGGLDWSPGCEAELFT